MKKFNLTADENDVLGDIFTHEGLRPLLKTIDQMAESMGKRVLTCNLEEIEACRLRYEGAHQLATELRSAISKAKES